MPRNASTPGSDAPGAVRQASAVGQLHGAGYAIDGPHPRVEPHADLEPLDGSRAAQGQRANGAGIDEPFLGQRRALIGRMRLLAAQDQRAAETFLTQRFGNLYAGLARANNDDRFLGIHDDPASIQL
jgi:hypothetical protein